MKVFRYLVPVDDRFHRVTLYGSIVHIETRDPRVVEIWAMHRDGAPPQVRWMRAYATGQHIPDDFVYIGTCVAREGLVWHLVEHPHLGPGDTPADAAPPDAVVKAAVNMRTIRPELREAG